MAFLGAPSLGLMLLWVGVVLTGLGSSSWNSVGMLAVITDAGVRGAGRASGVVLLGFLLGLGIGPPLFGWSVDVTGEYTVMWWLSIAAFVVALLDVGNLRVAC